MRVGFWDEIHGQTGVARDSIELTRCCGSRAPVQEKAEAVEEEAVAEEEGVARFPIQTSASRHTATRPRLRRYPSHQLQGPAPDPHGFEGDHDGVGCET